MSAKQEAKFLMYAAIAAIIYGIIAGMVIPA